MRLVAVILLLTHSMAALGEPLEDSRPYTLPNSHVIDIPTAAGAAAYQLYVHVPAACTAERRCPALYMLDAEYSFGLSALIVTHLSERERIPPLVSVAIGYPDKSRYRENRTRDYTPFFYPRGGYGEELQKVSGGGRAFLERLRTTIVPLVEKRFPVSGERRTLVGHSYGGLFAIFAWLEAPRLFQSYIIVSPSLWYGDRAILTEVENACAATEETSSGELFLAVGAHEEQPERGRPMVSDLRRLEGLVQSCSARAVDAVLRVFDNETHASVFPGALSTGIQALF